MEKNRKGEKPKMIKIEADNLEELYEKASKELMCSVADLEIDIIQQPSSLLGLFKKKAIAIVGIKQGATISKEYIEEDKDIIDSNSKPVSKPDDNSKPIIKTVEKNKTKKDGNSPEARTQRYASKNKHENNEDKTNDFIEEIYYSMQKLLKATPFDMNVVEIKMVEKKVIYIKLDGDDSSLLIGKDAYRYKALSYMLYTWIHTKYGFLIKLEISNFLENQEKSIKKYLDEVSQKIKDNGTGTTKPFEGVFMHIAVSHLRDLFPEKVVVILKNRNGDKYIKVHLDR